MEQIHFKGNILDLQIATKTPAEYRERVSNASNKDKSLNQKPMDASMAT